MINSFKIKNVRDTETGTAYRALGSLTHQPGGRARANIKKGTGFLSLFHLINSFEIYNPTKRLGKFLISALLNMKCKECPYYLN